MTRAPRSPRPARDRQEIRRDRHDLREARQEYREDRNRAWRDNDWQAWRGTNRALFARGAWNAPFRYRPFVVGVRIDPLYFGPRYVIAEPWRYHLPPAGYNQRWVRHYNDLLLVDVRRGIVVRVLRNFYW